MAEIRKQYCHIGYFVLDFGSLFFNDGCNFRITSPSKQVEQLGSFNTKSGAKITNGMKLFPIPLSSKCNQCIQKSA